MLNTSQLAPICATSPCRRRCTCAQAYCIWPAPVLANDVTPFPPIRERFQRCQLLIDTGFLNWTAGASSSAGGAAHAPVWMHGVHLVDAEEPGSVWQARSVLYWARPPAAHLWLTNVIVQSANTALVVTGGARASIAGARHDFLQCKVAAPPRGCKGLRQYSAAMI